MDAVRENASERRQRLTNERRQRRIDKDKQERLQIFEERRRYHALWCNVCFFVLSVIFKLLYVLYSWCLY